MKDHDWRIRRRLERGKLVYKRPCCNDRNNLNYSIALNRDIDRVILRCKVCGGLHYHTPASKGNFGVKARGG